jgi:formylglycine-generating enzyme required for sulfatase activity
MKHGIISFALILFVALTSTGRDRLYIENFNIAAGETLQVPVLLLNDTAYCGLQTDLFLPDGLSLDMEYDEYIIDLTSRKDNSHTVASRLLDNGAIRIYVSSLSARAFSGNSGAIMTLSITADSDFSGETAIELKNSVCAEAIGTRHVLDDEVCLVNHNGIRGDIDGDHNVTIADVTTLIDYLLSGDGSILSGDGDVDQDGKITIADVTALIDFLLIGHWPEPEEPEPTPVITSYTVNGVTFNMVEVEGGTFQMGATPEQGENANDNEKPVHQVTLSDFNIGQTEVTQELWQAVMGTNPSKFNNNVNKPVETISWEDCQTFIATLNNLTGQNFRLPTEAEWEFAARGGMKSQGYKYSGSNDLNEIAWYNYNAYAVGSSSPDYGTHAVSTKAANELGLYDMTGNVWEWCQDWSGEYSATDQINPTGPATGTNRVVRGGGWTNYPSLLRVATRAGYKPTFKGNFIGFRLAL